MFIKGLAFETFAVHTSNLDNFPVHSLYLGTLLSGRLSAKKASMYLKCNWARRALGWGRGGGATECDSPHLWGG